MTRFNWRALLAAATLAAVALSAHAQPAQSIVQGSIAATNDMVQIVTVDRASVGVQITGTYTGALSAQVTADNVNWITLTGATTFTSVTAGTAAATIPSGANDIYVVSISGATRLRIVALGAVTGTANVTLRPSTATAGGGSSAGGGGGGSVTVTNFPGTQPVSLASAPTTPVTGTFWQATQPVSVAALPSLTTGANTIGAVNQAGTWTVQPGNTANTTAWLTKDSVQTATGSITTQNLVPAGAATAGSAVAVALLGSQGFTVQVSGTYTGALSLQMTVDGTNWITVGGVPFLNVNTGAYTATITSAAQGIFQGNAGGALQARVTGLAAMTGTAVVTLIATSAPNGIALDTSIPPGANSIGNIGTVTSVTTLANGQTAHSSASTGSPVRVAGRVNTAVDTTLAAGDASDLFVTSSGALVEKPFSVPELDWQATSSTTALATTTSTAVKAAGAAGVRNYVTACQMINTSASVSTTVTLLDGVTVMWTGFLPATTAALPVVPSNPVFPTPLRGTAATAVNIQLGTTAASVYYNCQGFQAP